ncbi:ATP-binding protein [Inhella proteolytica]|uniref:Helix-turn-helix transcriptional regulator n=1 Tax=Inhella proteolytica TaxID=2795029 RepID=A0A931J1H4_9BURK|nr:winged helix-turn-helix domain-containing protein [Inhella proteolytica]MBH9576611.1 helix-turn-helix transcriptional regulator [Inhella proteolytica]
MQPLHFEPFCLDIANARLTRAGAPVELPPKAFAVLAHLAQRPGELVLKDQLLDAVWGRRFVSEGAIKTVVSELRAALGDDPRAPRWIETVQRRGYRFVAAVQGQQQAPAEAAAPQPPQGPERSPPRPGNLPTGLGALLGRADELRTLASLGRAARLITVTGTAGVGKTRLALEAAAARRAAHADGVWLLELAPLQAPTAQMLRATIARTVLGSSVGSEADAGLVRALHGLDLLLVVDNAEHVLEPLAPLLAHLHAQLPGLHLLVTSREPLHIPGEQLLNLAPLALPREEAGGAPPGAGDEAASFRLLVARIEARLPGFAPDAAQQAALARLCRLLDGLPLALELAAARVPVLGVHGLVEHLEADDRAAMRLQLLTQGPRTAVPHQRTLRATLDWSHALLSPDERRIFRRLAVFRGGFTLAAAQVVAADPGEPAWSVLDRLDALVAKSLVVAQRAGDAAPRFGLLESLREYAWEQLDAAGEGTSTARRHLAWACAHWREAARKALSEPVLPWSERLLPELDNLRAALRWGAEASGAASVEATVVDEALALLAASAPFWQRVGLSAEGGRWCLALGDLAAAHPDPLRSADYDLTAATLCRFTPLGTAEENLARARRAAATYAEQGDIDNEYLAQYLCWVLALEVSEAVDRQQAFERLRALVQPHWGALETRFVRSIVAQEARLRGDMEAFLATSRELVADLQAAGAQVESWTTTFLLMLAEHDLGSAERALALGQAALDQIRAAGLLRSQAQLLCMHTAMRAEAGDCAGTRAALVDALPLLGGMQACEVLLLALAWLAWHEGRAPDAARVLAWFRSPQRPSGSYGPRTFTQRTAQALAQRLEGQLGAAECARLAEAAEGLGDAEAVRLGLGPA